MPNDFVSCRIDGLDELETALLETTVKKARAAQREAMNFAGTFMQVCMVLAMNFKAGTGKLARSIVTKVVLSGKQDTATLSVGPSKDAFYSKWDEFGSIHNNPPEPFIRPAFETNKEKWLDVYANKLREVLGL